MRGHGQSIQNYKAMYEQVGAVDLCAIGTQTEGDVDTEGGSDDAAAISDMMIVFSFL